MHMPANDRTESNDDLSRLKDRRAEELVLRSQNEQDLDLLAVQGQPTVELANAWWVGDRAMQQLLRRRGVEPAVRDGRRRFTGGQRAALWLAANGTCELCGVDLESSWHADHVVAHANGGPTDVTNGQALCPPCNLLKGSSTMDEPLDGWISKPRIWQQQAFDTYRKMQAAERIFTIAVAPGGGKTQFALRCAYRELRETGEADRVIVVVPSAYLKEQLCNIASTKLGLNFAYEDSYVSNGSQIAHLSNPEAEGVVVTYQQVAMAPELFRTHVARHRIMVILDEVHHASDQNSWGSKLSYAFENARRVICMSGTPFRSASDERISFCRYTDEGELIADYEYSHGHAVRDSVCRRVQFHPLDAQVGWHDLKSRVDVKQLLSAGPHKRVMPTALDSAYTISEEDDAWLPTAIRSAWSLLQSTRIEMPDAACLVVCHSRAMAMRMSALISKVVGCPPPPVAVSIDPGEEGENGRAVIRQFAANGAKAPFLVAVQMVTEGVDIPRIIGVLWVSKVRQMLTFQQVVARAVRKRSDDEVLDAFIVVPHIPELIVLAQAIEQQQVDIFDEGATLEEALEKLEREIEREEDDPRYDSHASHDASQSQVIQSGLTYSGDEYGDAVAYIERHSMPRNLIPHVIQILRAERSRPVVMPEQPKIEKAPATARQRHKLIREQVNHIARKLAREFHMEHPEVWVLLKASVGAEPSKPLASFTEDELKAMYVTGVECAAAKVS